MYLYFLIIIEYWENLGPWGYTKSLEESKVVGILAEPYAHPSSATHPNAFTQRLGVIAHARLVCPYPWIYNGEK